MSFSNVPPGPLSSAPNMPWGPAANAAAFTPSNTATLPFQCRGLYIGSAGDVAVVMAGSPVNAAGTPVGVVFSAVPAGSILPVNAVGVLEDNTTASDIVALW